jgi:hypothetical protein
MALPRCRVVASRNPEPRIITRFQHCIERIDGKQLNLLALSLGGSMLRHTGRPPGALLAFQPSATWDAYLDRVEL